MSQARCTVSPLRTGLAVARAPPPPYHCCHAVSQQSCDCQLISVGLKARGVEFNTRLSILRQSQERA